MSAQILSGKKRKKQKGIGAFLSRPRNDPVVQRFTNVGHINCPWCPAGTPLFTEQGFATHKRMHQANNDPLLPQRAPGKVRVRFDLMTPEAIAKYHQEMARRSSSSNVVVLDGGDEEEMEVVENGDDDDGEEDGDALAEFFDNGVGGEMPPSGAHEHTNSAAGGDEGGGGDGDGETGEDAACNGNVVRQGNWKPSDIVKVLKKYDERRSGCSLKQFVRWVRKEHKRPKFCTYFIWRRESISY